MIFVLLVGILVRAVFLSIFLQAAISCFNKCFVRRPASADQSSTSLDLNNRVGLVEEIKLEDALLVMFIGDVFLALAGLLVGAMFHQELKPFLQGDIVHQAIVMGVSVFMEYLVLSVVLKYFIETTFVRAFAIILIQVLIRALVYALLLPLYYALG